MHVWLASRPFCMASRNAAHTQTAAASIGVGWGGGGGGGSAGAVCVQGSHTPEVPDLAIVPRFLTSSSLVMPPLSPPSNALERLKHQVKAWNS
jgi:hypothetical protein